MANDYLVSKWKLWYTILDVNHDGKVSVEDVEESRSKFCDLHQLSEDKAKLVKDNLFLWWEKYVFRGRTGEISESEFVESMSKDFAADNAKFKEQISECFNMIFDVIDTNKDRSISEEELMIAFKAYGHENVAQQSSLFQMYNPTEGNVPLRKVVESWINFVCSDNAADNDVVKQALEKSK